jgi:hypothetical protein
MVITMAEGYGHLAWAFGTDGLPVTDAVHLALGAKRQQVRLERWLTKPGHSAQNVWAANAYGSHNLHRG